MRTIDKRHICCLLGQPGTGKTHIAIALGLAACRQGRRVRFFTAAGLVNRLEEAQKQYQLEKILTQLDKTSLLICDELGYLSFSGHELGNLLSCSGVRDRGTKRELASRRVRKSSEARFDFSDAPNIDRIWTAIRCHESLSAAGG